MSAPRSAHSSVRVWDVPTRLFHWLLAALFGFSWWSAEQGEMDWHRLSGIGILTLLLFRLLWGFAGSSSARFARFLRSPVQVWAYLRGRVPPAPGHNPLGGYSVIAMLAALGAQVATGLFAVDVDGIESGPLSYRVSFDQGREAASGHAAIFTLLLGLVGLHLLAIVYYRLAKRRNLVRPMITGADPQLPAGMEDVAFAGYVRMGVCLIPAAALAWWVNNGMMVP